MRPGDLDVRDLGYRWGSLGKNDRLNVHWAAMQLPASLLDSRHHRKHSLARLSFLAMRAALLRKWCASARYCKEHVHGGGVGGAQP